MTGFIEGAETRSELFAQSPTLELALLGIKIHATVAPIIGLIIGCIIFGVGYKLTRVKVIANQVEIQDLGL